MKKVGFVVIAAILAVSAMAGVHMDKAVSAMTYVTDPANGLYNPVEGLPWVNGVNSPTAAAPALDNQSPSYLGAYFYSTAALIAGMHATGVNTDCADNAIERVFIWNYNSTGHPVAGVEPWWNENTGMLGFVPDSMIMCDALIPWRLDPAMAMPGSVHEIYLEKVLWSMYFLTISGEIEYTPYIAKTLRSIRNNPTFFNGGTGAIKYDNTDNLYLTALWGLVLESYTRSWELYPVRERAIRPPVLDYDWTYESEAAWLYVQAMMSYYFGVTLPGWWSDFHCPPSATMAPMDAARGLERWEYLPIMMFAAISGNTTVAEDLWDDNLDDVTPQQWRQDVRDYFWTGPLFDGTRCVYDPLGRWPGITSHYDIANVEMYMATEDAKYAERIIEVETDYWDPNQWSGDYYVHSGPMYNPTVIWNGLHAWALAHVPSVEITGITSNLPSLGILPYDYNANTGQDHVVTVRVTNTGLVPVDDLVLEFDEVYFSGTRSDMVAAPRIPVGAYVDVTYDVGGPGMAGDHSIDCDFTVASAAHVDYTVIDDDLFINVQDPAQVDVVFCGGSPESAPLNPFITIGQEFEFEVEIWNNGGATIREVEIDLTQSSPYGLILDFPDGTHFSGLVEIAGGTFGSVLFRAIAPLGVGGIIGDDIHVDVDLVRAVDENTRTDIVFGILTDDEEDFDIQYPPLLTVTNINSAPFWLNATNTVDVTVAISNAAGDYATADSIDVYNQMVEFVASVVGGVGGADLPSAAPANIPAGNAANVVFTVDNDGVTENAIVDIEYTGNYHDGNDGGNAEPMASPLTGTDAAGMGIDILAPTVNPVAPVAGATWPGDNVVQIDANDNLSGVNSVTIYLRDEVGGLYWNFATGVWQAGFTRRTFTYNAVSGYWERTLANHPSGEYIMYIDCDDNAGNDMPTDYVPIGDVAYIHIVEIWTDLWRGSIAAPLPHGSTWDYECDWNWAYRCSVMVYNPNAFIVEDVVVDLYSISPYTQAGIADLTGPIDIPALEYIWYVFDVIAPDYNFIDSLYAHTSDGTYDSGKPVAEQITDNDLLIKVEQPANFAIVSTWVEPSEINNWLGDLADDVEDTALVTLRQQFHYYVTVRNDGKDQIDSVRVSPFQAPAMGSIIIRISPTAWIYNFEAGEEQTFEFQVTASAGDPGDCPVQWDQDLGLSLIGASFTAHNHEPGYVIGLSSVIDDRAPIGIQQHPVLVTDDWAIEGTSIPAETTWINMTNTVAFDLWTINPLAMCCGTPYNDRAAVDRILSDPIHYPALLEFWDFSDPDPWDHVQTDEHIDGLMAHTVTEDMIWPGEMTQLTWGLSWDGTYGGTSEGVWWVIDRVFYGDNNNQLIFYGMNSPHVDTFSRVMGIDVSRPECEIIWPIDSVYQNFPETLLVLANDNLSGLVPESVKVQFEDPTGAIYNGTVWGTGSCWFTAHYDITYGADTFWYDTPTPTQEGCWTYSAYSYDIAGNQSLIDQVDFIWDATEPTCDIIYPAPGYYSYTATNIWDQLIEIWALDDTTAGAACVSHVKSVYVAIFDIIDSVWWDGSGWLASGTAYWLPCDPTGDPEVWDYDGYTDMSTVILEVYSYCRDSAGNFGPPCDTLHDVVVDEDKPNSVVTNRFGVELPNMWFVDLADWNTDMQDNFWGDAEDYLTRVDSVRYSVWDSLNNSYWNGAGWDGSSGEIWNTPNQYNWDGGGWFTPDSPPHAPDIDLGIGKELEWRTYFANPGFGYYKVRSKSYDDLGHIEPGFDAQNEKILIFDDCAPVIHPRYPDAGAVYFIWDWVDSFVVYAYDSCGWNMGGGMGAPVDEVRFWIINPDGKYWGWVPILGWRWCDFELSIPGVQVNDSLWKPFNIPLISQEGTYTMFVRARDFNGNTVLNAWSWTITVSGEFITIETIPNDPGRDWYFVDEDFTLRVIAWAHPGVPDVSFAHEFFFGDNMPLPENFSIDTPGPYFAFRGTLDVVGSCDVPVLGLEAFVDAPSSFLPRASTSPIDIIQLVDDDLGGFVMDNSAANGYWDDQGNWMWLHHNRTTQDPDYSGPDPIDTMSVKIVGYQYCRDTDVSAAPGDTNWQPLVIVGNASDGDSVKLEFGNANTFIVYDYSMIVEVQVQGIGVHIFTDRIPLGNGVPIDNIPPQTVGDVTIGAVGGAIRLDWPEARLGSDLGATPEINPEINIVYDVYRFTDPLTDLDARAATPTFVGVTDTFLVDAAGAGDVTTPYYYSVKARDTHGEIVEQMSPDYTAYVGEVDYIIDAGWNPIAYPLPVAGLVAPADYVARLGAPLGDIYAYANPPALWEEILVGPFGRDLVDDGSEDLLAYSAWTGTATWTGNLPADLYIDYNLAIGYNGIMIPLIRDDLIMASDLYYELEGLGLSPVTIARMVPSDGWNDIVVHEGAIYFDFPIYPGQAYLAWVNVAGTWPEYPAHPRPAKSARTVMPTRTSDAIPTPKCGAIPIVGEDKADIERISARAIWGEQEQTCSTDGNLVKIEVSKFEGIATGAEVSVEVVGDDGIYYGETVITVGEDPITVASTLTLAKVAPSLPEQFALHGNVPNPFNPATSIAFDLPEETQVDLSVYNITGQMVRKVVSEKLPAGYHHVVWDGRVDNGRIAPAGVYFYTLRAGDFSAQRRMMLVK